MGRGDSPPSSSLAPDVERQRSRQDLTRTGESYDVDAACGLHNAETIARAILETQRIDDFVARPNVYGGCAERQIAGIIIFDGCVSAPIDV